MYFSLIIAFAMIVESIHVLKTGMIGYELYGSFFIGDYKYPMSFVFFIFGIYALYITYKTYKNQKYNKPKSEYTICPKCKESYNYSDLEDGMCPKCDIKTVDIEEYYKKKKEEKQND